MWSPVFAFPEDLVSAEAGDEPKASFYERAPHVDLFPEHHPMAALFIKNHRL